MEDERARQERVKREKKELELNDELEDSFPASDPPSITQPKPAAGAPKGRESVEHQDEK
ncbi:MAG: hypothetical protein AB7F96_17205 [Beijerinckiaceae bacterium]